MVLTGNAKIYDLQNPPTDSISEIAFSNLHTMMITSSWDGSIQLYNPLSSTGFISKVAYDKPMLTCCFSKDMGPHAFGGSVDGNIHFIDLEKSAMNSIKGHSDGIKSIRSSQYSIITGSWDKTIKVWDTRSAQCVRTIDCDGKVYCMDLKNNLLCYGTSTNGLYSSNMNNLESKKKNSTRLAYMLKCVSCGSDDKSVLVGGVEGKCEMINTTSYYGGISFRSHRKESKVFGVNTVSFCPKNDNVLVTGGGNGDLIFYDSLSRVKTFTKSEDEPITCGAFSSDSKLYAYGLGDDWSKGYDGMYRKVSLKVMQVDTLGLKI